MSQLKDNCSFANLRRSIAQELHSFGIEQDEANAEALLIIESVTGKNLVEQVLTETVAISTTWRNQIEKILAGRKKRMPLQYMLGYANFLDLQLNIKSGVFIPKGDTETLVVVTLAMLAQIGAASWGEVHIAEIGVGAAPVAISLLKRLPNSRVWACDIEPAAIELAYENAVQHGVADRLQLVEGDWHKIMPQSLKFDVIVANPPYIPISEQSNLAPEIALYEPKSALFDQDPKGLGFYRDFAQDCATSLKLRNGFIALEIGDGQSQLVQKLFLKQGWNSVTIHADINGLARVLTAKR